MGSGARFVVRGERKRAVALRELGASAQENREDELRQEDAHEHGQGVDGGITHGRGVVAGGGVGKSQRGGIGVRTGDESHEGEVVQLHLQAGENAHNQDGDRRDEHTHPHIVDTVALRDRFPERSTGLNTDTAEEEHETHFAQEKVGRGGDVGIDLITVAHGADEDGYDERPPARPSFTGTVTPGMGMGICPTMIPMRIPKKIAPTLG